VKLIESDEIKELKEDYGIMMLMEKDKDGKLDGYQVQIAPMHISDEKVLRNMAHVMIKNFIEEKNSENPAERAKRIVEEKMGGEKNVWMAKKKN